MEQIILDEILLNPDQWNCTCKTLRDNLKYFLTRLGVYAYSSEVFSWERLPLKATLIDTPHYKQETYPTSIQCIQRICVQVKI
jgi:hypothetical protein